MTDVDNKEIIIVVYFSFGRVSDEGNYEVYLIKVGREIN